MIQKALGGKKMKRHPNTMKLAGLLVLVVLTVGTTAQAQCPVCGSFTLPFEVEWGGDLLPVGHYTFEVQSAMHLFVAIRSVEHPHDARLIGPATTVSEAPLHNGALRIVTVDGKRYVHTLDISTVGVSFIYKTPKSRREKFHSTNEVSRITVAVAHQER
jgi:hypothetical protein